MIINNYIMAISIMITPKVHVRKFPACTVRYPPESPPRPMSDGQNCNRHCTFITKY